MNMNIAASIVDHNTLSYSSDFVAEMALLIDGPEEMRRKFREMRLGPPGFAEAAKAAADSPVILPADDEDRYRRALGLVRVIGYAAGVELDEIGHTGDMSHLYRIFREGTVSSNKRQVIGSNIERAFFEAGLGAGTILFNVRKCENAEDVRGTIADAETAFREGVLLRH